MIRHVPVLLRPEWNCPDDTYHQDLAAAEAQALLEFPGVFVDA
ncbi:MAG: hypothetical protein ACLQK4_10780 [Acidimicrobiales bacterium]